VRAKPDFRSVRAIGVPIAPSPMNAIFMDPPLEQ
jgi:hypothetical protein